MCQSTWVLHHIRMRQSIWVLHHILIRQSIWVSHNRRHMSTRNWCMNLRMDWRMRHLMRCDVPWDIRRSWSDVSTRFVFESTYGLTHETAHVWQVSSPVDAFLIQHENSHNMKIEFCHRTYNHNKPLRTFLQTQTEPNKTNTSTPRHLMHEMSHTRRFSQVAWSLHDSHVLSSIFSSTYVSCCMRWTSLALPYVVRVGFKV